ncbi:hypothetical protein DH2020_043318 [Rehmannia glutinosa]|uniref:GDSL esterase/lipase n=1 Tax=Rehmannia glutinosa TaxID=99300 RepID=A0ABR0UKX1_REHGL
MGVSILHSFVHVHAWGGGFGPRMCSSKLDDANECHVILAYLLSTADGIERIKGASDVKKLINQLFIPSSLPPDYLYHFGDGVTDIGNSIYVLPKVTIPHGRWPYGMTFPGYPTGRWSDAEDFGLPDIVPYLNMNHTRAASYHGVIFSVGRSPVLDHCSEWIGNSLVLMGDIEGNDIGYALTQGKSIEEVQTYVPAIVKAIIDATREVIELGATQAIIPGNAPLGCLPYILTALRTKDSTAYDELGCLKSVNDLTIWKNDYLQQAITNLSSEYPNVRILYGPMYDGVLSLIANASVIGPDGNTACTKILLWNWRKI